MSTNNRDITFAIRLTQEEYDTFVYGAELDGRTVSDFIRRGALIYAQKLIDADDEKWRSDYIKHMTNK